MILYLVIVILITSCQSSTVSIKYEITFFTLAEKGFVDDVRLVNRMQVEFFLTSDGEEYVVNSLENHYEEMRKALNERRNKERIEFSVKILDADGFTTYLHEMNKMLKEKGENAVKVRPVNRP